MCVCTRFSPLTPSSRLLCAPTGAGKTNVAMLTMLHTIGENLVGDTGKVDPKSFKIVYIAPMKVRGDSNA